MVAHAGNSTRLRHCQPQGRRNPKSGLLVVGLPVRVHSVLSLLGPRVSQILSHLSHPIAHGWLAVGLRGVVGALRSIASSVRFWTSTEVPLPNLPAFA